jgi:hypothetical protein
MDSALTIDVRDIVWHGAGRNAGIDFRAGWSRRWRDRVMRRPGEVLVFKPVIKSWRDLVVFTSGKSQYLISKVLNVVFNASTTLVNPSTVYFGLWRSGSALTAASTGSTSGEVTTTPGATGYAAYARVAVTVSSTTNFAASSSGSALTNATAITWGTDASGTPTVVSVGIFDASSAGNMLYFGDITSITLAAGETPQINISGLTISEA